MSKIPFTIRNSGRYYFRRRFRSGNGSDFIVIIPLKTCIAQEARGRSAELAARFERIRRTVEAYFGSDQELEPVMLKGLFEAELQHCLRMFIEEFHSGQLNPKALINKHRTHASACDIAQRPGTSSELSEADRARLADAGHSEHDIEWVACDLDRFCGKSTVETEIMAVIAEEYGVEPTPSVINLMKSVHLRARAEAHRLATHYMDDDVQASLNQEAALLKKQRAEGEVLSFATSAAESSIPSLPLQLNNDAAIPDECPFKRYDARKFSSVIEEVIEKAQRQGRWNHGIPQYRRVLQTFAWITGDKALGDYDHTDVEKFLDGLMSLPKNYRPQKDMDKPFDEIAAGLSTKVHERRSLTTMNRDLSYLSTAYDILSKGSWAPKIPNTKVLDFGGAYLKNAKKAAQANGRRPWSVEHMRTLFSAPLWNGSGGSLKRLKANGDGAVFHDAAYWLPILLYYTHAALNEIAGLAVDEVFLDAKVPFIRIKNNEIRGSETLKAGEKTTNRGRDVPLHKEVLRLGFADYVAAIAKEGSKELFPELYLNEAKVGGDQFRNVAWRHMVKWIASKMEIPVNEKGKRADIHSIRTLGSSFYAVDGVLDLMRADIMGHARTGTNALHYSKRIESHGVDLVMGEYREFMEKYTQLATSELAPLPIRLLPIIHRSRTGSPPKR